LPDPSKRDDWGGYALVIDRKTIDQLTAVRAQAKAMAMTSSVWRKKRAVGRNSRLEPCLAAIVDARGGIRRPRAIGKGGKEIGELCFAAFRNEPRHGVASTPAAGSKTTCRNGAWRSVRVMAPSRGMPRLYRADENGC